MKYYLVTYDIREVDADRYPEVYDALDELGAVQALQSVYLLEFEGTAKELFRRLKSHVTKKTKLLVVEVTKNNWWTISTDGANWMQEREL